MYSCQIRRCILFGLVFTLGLCGYVWGTDLIDDISIKFQDDYELGLSDGYLELSYSPIYSKDPFLDAMSVYTGMSSQTRVAGVRYVERALASNGCGLSKEKQWAILYYFVPEFRGEIAREMKINGSDSASDNYTFNDNDILKYCTEFYNCITHKSSGESGDGVEEITSDTPKDPKTNCKEFFQNNYREGQLEEKRIQNLQIAWLGNDKYLNATTEESPYDVMTDLGVVGELSYLQAKKPITPVFYNLSIFGKSTDALLNGKNGGAGEVEETYGGVVPATEQISIGGDNKSLEKQTILDDGVSLGGGTSLATTPSIEKQVSLGGNMNDLEKTAFLNETQTLGKVEVDDTTNRLQTSNSSVKPLSRVKSLTREGYDSLIEGLGAYKLNNDNSVYYGSLCKDEEAEPEIESVQKERVSITRDDIGTDVSDLAKEEYQELVDYMLDAVNSYVSLSEDKIKEIEKKSVNPDKISNVSTPEQTEAVAKKILGCYQSCVGLSVDEQFACMLKCSCGEITSPIFDPEINPGMGPIYMIRYCAVPSVDPRYFNEGSDGTDSWTSTLLGGLFNGKGTKNKGGSNGKGTKNKGGSNEEGNSSFINVIGSSFNKGGTKMVGMEKGTNEILGVVEKLAREGRLGMWTQQYNFLDSSTKMMDVADTFSFTISADKKKVSEQTGKPTEEYMKRVMKNNDDNWLAVNHVANPLDNPATKNYYCLVGSCARGGIVGNITVNSSTSNNSQGYLNVAPGFIVDQSENSNAARYAEISKLFSEWLDEQGDFWADKVDYLKEMDSYAKSLYAKKG